MLKHALHFRWPGFYVKIKNDINALENHKASKTSIPSFYINLYDYIQVFIERADSIKTFSIR